MMLAHDKCLYIHHTRQLNIRGAYDHLYLTTIMRVMMVAPGLLCKSAVKLMLLAASESMHG